MFMSVMACVGPKGTTTKTVNAASTTMNGRHPENKGIGLGGNDVFFEQQFDGVGDRLQQSVRADAHGAEAHLHVRQNFSLQPVHRNDGDRESAEHQQDVDNRPENVSRAAGRLLLSR